MTLKRLQYFIWLFGLLFSVTLHAQQSNEYSIQYYSTNDGLSQNEVTSIIQDKYGFMWFGTRGGLNRFDGYNFKRFKPEPNNPNSLHNPSIERLYKDNKGRIWIGTKSGGCSIYDTGNEQFSIPADSINSIPDRIISFKEDSAGAMWIGSWNRGMYKLGEQLYSKERLHNDFRVSTFEITDDSSVYVGTVQGLFNINRRKITKVRAGIGGREITEMIKDKEKPVLWMVGWGLNLSGYDYINQKTTEYSIPITEEGNSNAYSIHQDKKGNIWVGTWGHGLYKFDTKNAQFTKIPLAPANASNFDFNIILDIYEDSMGNIWIGTDGGGIVKISPKSNFNTLTNLHNRNIKISALEVDNEGNVWIGTQGNGLFLRNTKGEMHPIAFKSNIKKSISQIFIRKIHQDTNGNIWVNLSSGIYIIQKNRNDNYELILAHDYFNSPDFKNINKVHDVAVDGNRLWIATQQSGLYLLEHKSNKYERRKHFIKSDSKDGLTSDRVTSIIFDDLNRMLVATYDGLMLYNVVDSIFTPVNDIITNDQRPLCEIIICAYKDKKQNIWFGTPCSLNKLTPAGDGTFTFEEYTRSSGLSDDYVNAIQEDNLGFIWLSTNAGISRLCSETGDIRNFDVLDGLGDTDFSEAASCKGLDGTLYFGGANTITYFKPHEIIEDDKQPQIVISEFKILNKTVTVADDILPISINEVDEIVLGYKEKEFSFEFSVLDYKASEKKQYAYWLEGYEEDWNKIGNRRHISFNNLKPLVYKLHIKGTNSHGVWNSDVKTIQIKVLSPPWKTWYAIIAYVLIILGVVALISMAGIKQERLQNAVDMEKVSREHEKQLNKYKFRFFTNISHEIRTPLTLIIGPIKELMQTDHSEISRNYLSGKLELVYHNVNRLYSLINQLLEFTKVEAGKLVLQVAEYSLTQFIDEVCTSYKHMAVSKNIKYVVHNSGPLKLYFDKERLSVVLYNLLSNAFKYAGNPGVVKVQVEEHEKEVVIRVFNNGKGISENDKKHLFDRFYQAGEIQHMGSSGIGLALAKNYMDLHAGKIMVESIPNESATFTIVLKKGKEHLKNVKIIEDDIQTTITESYTTHETNESVKKRSINNKSKGASILIVEDNADVKMYLSNLFDEHFNVITASNGFEGFEKAIQALPDLIVSDVMMPRMDGFELCEKIKTHDKLRHIPVLLLTAKSTDRDLLFGTKKGADAYLKKPFDPTILLEKSKQLIASRIILKEKYTKRVVLDATNKEITSEEEKIISKSIQLIETNANKRQLKPEFLAQKMAMSPSTFYRKMKKATGLSPGELIKQTRLKLAARYLKESNFTVSEIIENVGYLDSKHFRENFKGYFGMLPDEYRKSDIEKPNQIKKI
ncbi:two-component regulator propeller domain-containing protein [Draconibacterium orientale]|uniref:hybrid sensor histidine kinase/response regulator transcription factor n=1 Tax=Draconibacterium orientale TaxID=1168034 RepID=UPI002ABD4111|nr:two-component regulator propeller domain-containing protein [Draconibacterium orientale]